MMRPVWAVMVFVATTVAVLYGGYAVANESEVDGPELEGSAELYPVSIQVDGGDTGLEAGSPCDIRVRSFYPLRSYKAHRSAHAKLGERTVVKVPRGSHDIIAFVPGKAFAVRRFVTPREDEARVTLRRANPRLLRIRLIRKEGGEPVVNRAIYLYKGIREVLYYVRSAVRSNKEGVLEHLAPEFSLEDDYYLRLGSRMSPVRFADKSTEVLVQKDWWASQQPVPVRVMELPQNGTVSCMLMRPKGKPVPFTDKNIAEMLGQEVSTKTVRLDRYGQLGTGSFRMEDDKVIVFGMSDGVYRVRECYLVLKEGPDDPVRIFVPSNPRTKVPIKNGRIAGAPGIYFQMRQPGESTEPAKGLGP